jgi:Cu/Zn superoxide dismutase
MTSAIAVFRGPDVTGRAVFIRISDQAALVDIKLSIKSSSAPNENQRLFGCHIHEYGNILQGCAGNETIGETSIDLLGSHWNPDSTKHPYHAGDLLNNIKVNRFGDAHVQFIDNNGLLASCERNILGRSVVVHSGTDDCGQHPDNPESQKNGNSGRMIGCAVIGRCTREFANNLLDSDSTSAIITSDKRQCL